MAKTRVAPLNKPSIARLELFAAHCLAKLKDYIVKVIGHHIRLDETHYWLDSEIALAWIAKPSSRWKTLVRNRVQEIYDLTSASDWKYCPGVENPADLHSRGMKLQDLKTSELYWKGPDWLKHDKDKWPQNIQAQQRVNENKTKEIFDKIEEEAVPKKSLIITTEESNPYPCIIERFREYRKILRVTARILRWKNKVLDKKQYESSLLSLDEITEAENHLISMIQQRHFSEEYKALTTGQTIPSNSTIINYDPKWDSKRKIIIGGDRLKLSTLPEETKSPIILPNRNVLVEKLILHTHVKNTHCSQDTTIALLRERFHIVHFREEVRRALKKCIICKHSNTRPLEQKMGILPEERVKVSSAFSDIGIDFTGVIYLKSYNGKTTRKAYICIFTCTHSRMVHFELTNDMTTEEFLSALRRMMNRRGRCHTIFSDNQTTFLKKSEKVINISLATLLKKTNG